MVLRQLLQSNLFLQMRTDYTIWKEMYGSGVRIFIDRITMPTAQRRIRKDQPIRTTHRNPVWSSGYSVEDLSCVMISTVNATKLEVEGKVRLIARPIM